VLYEMLTGERPFRGDNPVSTLQNIALTEPRPPAELRDDLPEEVAVIVHRALVKDREGRYQAMAEMDADLRAAASGAASGAPVSLPSGTTSAMVTNLRGSPATSSSASSASSAAAASGESAGPFAVQQPIAPAPLARIGKIAVPLLVVVAIVWAGRDRLPWPGSFDGADTDTGAPAGDTTTPLPTTPFGHYQAGLDYLQRYDRPGYIEQALDSFQRAIGMDEQYAPGYAGYARASWLEYRSSQDDIWLDRARNNAERAVELSPQLSFARATLAQVLIEQGELDAAQQNIDAALAADPDSPEAHSALAYLHRAREEPDAAEAEHLRAVALRPDDWSLQQDLGDFYFGQGRYEDALAPMQEAVRLTPDNGTAHRDLAAVQQMLGDYAAAARSLQQSLAINATASGYSNLGTLYFYQSLYQQSVDAFEQALQLGANDYLIWANLGDAYRWTPDNEDNARDAYQRALQLLEPELGRNPDDPTLRSRHALYLAKSGAGAGALADLALIDWSESDDLNLLYRIIPAYEIAGDRDTALEVLEAALEAGLPLSFITDEPELTDLRSDPRYHRIAARFSGSPSA
jgi:serine/threonine-protein kinase